MAGSVPEREFEETEHKAAALRRAIELAAGSDEGRSRNGTGAATASGGSEPAAQTGVRP